MKSVIFFYILGIWISCALYIYGVQKVSIEMSLIKKKHEFLMFLVKHIHFTSIFVQIILQENPYLIFPYLSIRVIFCVGVGVCFALFSIVGLALIVHGEVPDVFRFRYISMDSSDASMHLFWNLVIFCGAGIVISKCEFKLYFSLQ